MATVALLATSVLSGSTELSSDERALICEKQVEKLRHDVVVVWCPSSLHGVPAPLAVMCTNGLTIWSKHF